MLGSSRGLGLRIFIPATRIRIPYALLKILKERKATQTGEEDALEKH